MILAKTDIAISWFCEVENGVEKIATQNLTKWWKVLFSLRPKYHQVSTLVRHHVQGWRLHTCRLWIFQQHCRRKMCYPLMLEKGNWWIINSGSCRWGSDCSGWSRTSRRGNSLSHPAVNSIVLAASRTQGRSELSRVNFCGSLQRISVCSLNACVPKASLNSNCEDKKASSQ